MSGFALGKVLPQNTIIHDKRATAVRDGHPWGTKKLRRLRRKQRRQLRALPSRVVAGLHTPRPAIALEGDGMIVELELRRRADDWVEREGVGHVLDEFESRLAQVLLAEALQNTDVTADAELVLKQGEGRDTTPELEDASLYAALRVFATLSIMADRLSDDDYLDPRVH